ncbi:fimbrial protein [Burkholderia cenocepacia]|uniref:fimbrial protein n=1 Tax=Burkholderia cenocepacia TaxID=95486 RepID=UPI000F5BFF77|nr:fimbrial protein [Burkholderia cenocepacia]
MNFIYFKNFYGARMCRIRLLVKSFFWGVACLLAPQTNALACELGVFSSSTSVKVPANITASRDAYVPGTLVGPNALTSEKTSVIYNDCKAEMTITATALGTPVPGVTYRVDGQTHPVYETGVPGVGFAVMAGVQQQSTGGWTVLGPGEIEVAKVPASNYKWYTVFRVALVFSGQIETGSYTSKPRPMFRFRISGSNGYSDSRTISLDPFTLNVTASGCSLTSAANSNISLSRVYAGKLAAVGDVSDVVGTTSLQVSCRGTVDVYVTMTDVANPVNTTDVLSLSSGSTARGVGLRLYRANDASKISFGPDSSAKGNTNQWFVGRGRDNTLSIPLAVRYVRTGPLTAGTVNAATTFTFSYQ